MCLFRGSFVGIDDAHQHDPCVTSAQPHLIERPTDSKIYWRTTLCNNTHSKIVQKKIFGGRANLISNGFIRFSRFTTAVVLVEVPYCAYGYSVERPWTGGQSLPLQQVFEFVGIEPFTSSLTSWPTPFKKPKLALVCSHCKAAALSCSKSFWSHPGTFS